LKRYISIIVCIALLVTLCACSKNDTSSNSSSNTNTENELDFKAPTKESEAEMPSKGEQDSPEIFTVEPTKINKANIFKQDEVISYKDFSFSNFKMVKSKELPQGITKEQVENFSGEDIDLNGALTGSKTYAFVTMDIKNLTEQAINLCVSSSEFILLDDNFSFGMYMDNCRYRSGRSHNQAKDYYFQNIKPQESYTVTIGYVLDDTMINADNLYFFATSNIDKNSKGYKIN